MDFYACFQGATHGTVAGPKEDGVVGVGEDGGPDLGG
jgi:hypothetical protein